MTSPAVFILYSVLVGSSIYVITSEQTDNISKQHKNMRIIKETLHGLVKEDVDSENQRMKTRNNVFNIFNYRINNLDNLTYATNSYRKRQNEHHSANVKKHEKMYIKNDSVLDTHLNIYSHYDDNSNKSISSVNNFNKKKRVKRDENPSKCDSFSFKKGKAYISHPHVGDSDNINYSGNTYCTTVISGSDGYVVQLTFVDMFHIEDHPECNYDFLEVRDGDQGYYNLLGKVCGEKFPTQITTTGPNAWVKFYSDDTIEYAGFRIQIDFILRDSSVRVPESCVTELSGKSGKFDSKNLNEDCKENIENQALDYRWSIDVPEGHKIYLNFTSYIVSEPNECDKNFVQVFGSVLEYDEKLAHYCGSVAMPVATITRPTLKAGEGGKILDQGNIMHVRLYAAREQRTKTFIDATFTAYRSLDPSKNNTCDTVTEFDCEDNTCIDVALRCNNYANCRLKADEEKDLCKVRGCNPTPGWYREFIDRKTQDQTRQVINLEPTNDPVLRQHTTESLIQQPRIQIILSCFCVILSGISFVFFFKCIKKLYNDYTTIKKQINQSVEERLNSMIGSQLVLDAKKMQRDDGPRASLERDNHSNEMFKQQRKLQENERVAKREFDEELWRRVNDVAKTENIRIERNEKTKRKKEQEIEELKIENNERSSREEEQEMERNERTRRKAEKGNSRRRSEFSNKDALPKMEDSEEISDISELRDVSVSFPDTKQFGCQTRDSLFQTDPIMKSDGSGTSNGRGLPKFTHSGSSIARPSPPEIKPSEITIEIISPITEQEKPQRKVPVNRPMSAETTRSAPDVIVLAKPTP